MNVTIVGGGNIGTQFAVHFASKGNSVTVFTSRPQQFNKVLNITDETGKVQLTGTVTQATSDAKTAFSNADLVLVTVPAFAMAKAAEQIFPYIPAGAKIGLVPGTGGGEHPFSPCIKKGCTLFGLQRVPSVARLTQYGKTVCATGYRGMLHIASIPAKDAQNCKKIIESAFDIPCTVMPNYLNLTLTPSNPILHTTRLCTLFADYSDGKVYDYIPLFYEEWSNESSRLLLACDEEVQTLCSAFSPLDLSFVRSLKEHYESDTAEKLTAKIRSIQSFKGLCTPAVTVENGKIPDFSSRYFTADFSYGLDILVQLADLMEVKMPNCRKTLEWYHSVAHPTRRFNFADYGITNRNDLIAFYNR